MALACEDNFHRDSGQPKIQFFTSQNTEYTLFTFFAILVGLSLVAIPWERVILRKRRRSPFRPRPIENKGGEKVEDEKESRLKRACQTAGGEVLGNDAGC
jgi:hypothetical protein